MDAAVHTHTWGGGVGGLLWGLLATTTRASTARRSAPSPPVCRSSNTTHNWGG